MKLIFLLLGRSWGGVSSSSSSAPPPPPFNKFMCSKLDYRRKMRDGQGWIRGYRGGGVCCEVQVKEIIMQSLCYF